MGHGRLIITTPKKTAEWLIKLYAKDIVNDDTTGHIDYYNKEDMLKMTAGYYKLLSYRKFIFGMNQLFVFEK
jgi:hypothetical protein